MNPPGARICRTALVIGVAATAGTWSALAQTVRGTVADSTTSHPLTACYVSLLDRGQQPVARVLTDTAGRFALNAPGPGRYALQFDLLGYRTVVSEPFVLERPSDIALAVFLAAAAVGLPPLTVTAAEVPDTRLVDGGFYQRRRAGPGAFLEPKQIAERLPRARQFVDLLRGTAGVSLTQNDPGSRGTSPRLRGMPSLSRPCVVPRVYINGVVVRLDEGNARNATRDLNELIQPEEVLAIEIYRGPSEIPEQYSGPESGCGVMLIWTKH